MNKAVQPLRAHGEETGPTGEQSLSVIDALRSRDPTIHGAAIAAAGQFTRLLMFIAAKRWSVDMAASELQRDARKNRLVQTAKVGLSVSALFLFLFLYAIGVHLLSMLAIVVGVFLFDSSAGSRRQRVRTILTYGDASLVGVLAVTLKDRSIMVRSDAAQALVALLPMVKASHRGRFHSEEMQALLAIPKRHHQQLTLALIAALSRIGDRRSLPVLDSLCAVANPDIKEQARTAREAVLVNLEHDRQTASLLRASAADEYTGAQQLLRPQGSGSDSEQREQLLRTSGTP